MANPPLKFFLDRNRFEDWIAHNPNVGVDGHGVEAPGADFRGLPLVGADFTSANLENAVFDDCDLSGAKFRTTRLAGASFRRTRLVGTDLELAKLDGAHFEGVRAAESVSFPSARLKDVVAEGVRFRKANLAQAHLEGVSLKGSDLAHADLTGVNLLRADLRGTNLYGAELTNTTWGEVRLDKDTNLEATVWRPEHDSPNDRSESLRLSSVQKAFSWNAIRFLADIPLFGGAYLLLVLTLVFVSVVEWLNANPFVLAFQYPVPLPTSTRLLLLGSVFLAVGSTVFQIACPPRVREFSRARWVEELSRPGVLHVWEGLRRPLAAGSSMVLVAAGAVLVGIVFIERLGRAVFYVITAIN